MDSKTRFSQDIENLKINSPDVPYIDIISEYTELNEIDHELVPRLLTESLFQKIRAESIKLNNLDIVEDHYPMDELL